MSNCEHDWRHETEGLRCNLCLRLATVEWLLDELSDVKKERNELRERLDKSENERDAFRAVLAQMWRALCDEQAP